MPAEPPKTAILLETTGNCPHCNRPLLSLAVDRCSFCGLGLEDVFPALPAVASRLSAMAHGWTPEAFTEWARPRPEQLLWVLGTGNWKLLGYWAAEDLWRTWARLFASLKGRSRARAVEDLELDSLAICGIGEFEPWVKLRLEGTRADYRWDPATGATLHGQVEPTFFRELWTFVPTGVPIEKTEHQCTVCGGGLAFTDLDCTYCGCPVNPAPGPWKLVSVRAESRDGEIQRSPFEASAFESSAPD